MINHHEKKINEFLDNYLSLENFTPGFDRLLPVFQKFKKSFEINGLKIVTIAGTNGKGETAQCLAHLLTKNGINCALWTSPHINSVRERFKFNNELIDSEVLLNTLIDSYEQTREFGLSYYEFLFYVFCELTLKQYNLDVVILEVGLGGRLDTVNVFDAHLSCVTSISKDHVEFLGEDLEGILYEKLGVTRANSLCLFNLDQKELRKAAQKHLITKQTPYVNLFDNGYVSSSWPYFRRNQMLSFLLYKSIVNAPLDSVSDIHKEFENTQFPRLKGRFEKVTLGNNTFIFIGAHNLDGFKKVYDYFSSQSADDFYELPKEFDECLVAFSKRSKEEVIACLETFSKINQINNPLNVTSFDHFKALSSDDLLKVLTEVPTVDHISCWKEFIKSLKNDAPKNILVTGSYYFISKVQQELQ